MTTQPIEDGLTVALNATIAALALTMRAVTDQEARAVTDQQARRDRDELRRRESLRVVLDEHTRRSS
jgi:hypothetical protein